MRIRWILLILHHSRTRTPMHLSAKTPPVYTRIRKHTVELINRPYPDLLATIRFGNYTFRFNGYARIPALYWFPAKFTATARCWRQCNFPGSSTTAKPSWTFISLKIRKWLLPSKSCVWCRLYVSGTLREQFLSTSKYGSWINYRENIVSLSFSQQREILNRKGLEKIQLYLRKLFFR